MSGSHLARQAGICGGVAGIPPTRVSDKRAFSQTSVLPVGADSTSAQRLSASTNGSRGYGETVAVTHSGCSTPFGINEWFTMQLDDLNVEDVGAQRLSASTNGSRPASAESICRPDVLNAFRHQRMVHGERAHLVCMLIHVLNAFRHQRMVHDATRPTRG